MHTFHLTIRSPDQEIFKGDVQSVTLATEEKGLMMILPGHASLTGTIFLSPIIITTKDGEEDFIAKRGVIHVSVEHKSAEILCLSCEKKKEISFQTIKEYLDFIEEQLKKHGDLTNYQLTHLQKEKLALEHTMIEVSKNNP